MKKPVRHAWTCSCGEVLSVSALPMKGDPDHLVTPDRVICVCDQHYRITVKKTGYREFTITESVTQPPKDSWGMDPRRTR